MYQSATTHSSQLEYTNGNRRIALWISDGRTRDVVVRAVRASGGRPFLLADLADLVGLWDICAGTICDLAPWDGEALVRFKRVYRETSTGAFILYTPADMRDVAAELEDGAARCVMQNFSRDGICALEEAICWLLESGPSSRIIRTILEESPHVNETTKRFLWWCIRSVAGQGRAPVAHGATAVGTTPRTLVRRLRDAGLPPPCETNRWVKLMAVAWKAEQWGTRLGTAAHSFDIGPTDLYQLKIGLLKSRRMQAFRTTRNLLRFVEGAFRERCAEIRAEGAALVERLA